MGRVAIGTKRFFFLALALVLLAGAAVAWAERKPLLAWYYLRQLDGAEGDDARAWAERAAGLEDVVVPDLVEMLGGDDRACANARLALDCLAARWGTEDARCVDLVERVAKAFPRLSRTGQLEALRLAVGWAPRDGACPQALASAAGRLLAGAARHPDAAAHQQGLELALRVLPRVEQAELLCPGRELARLCLRSADAATRRRAAELAVRPGLDLCKEVVPLLRDPCPRVRRAVLAAVGPSPAVIHTDNLLPWLQDPDPEVRRLCEAALVQRGLKPHHVRLARLITDPHWSVRLKVLDTLAEAEELDAGVWLRLLSRDPSPAVRVAAIRAACEESLADLSDRIDQMAHHDPSPTVCGLARHYLRQRRGRTHNSE